MTDKNHYSFSYKLEEDNFTEKIIRHKFLIFLINHINLIDPTNTMNPEYDPLHTEYLFTLRNKLTIGYNLRDGIITMIDGDIFAMYKNISRNILKYIMKKLKIYDDMDVETNYSKYLKYKNKYLVLKNIVRHN